MSSITRYGYDNPGAKRMVFIHGAGLDATVWTSQARYFAARGIDAIGVNLPMHGSNTEPLRGSIADMAAWVAETVGDVDQDNLTVAGHSMGGLVALHCSVHWPHACYILLGVASTIPVHPALLKAAQDNLPQAAAMIADWGFATGIQHMRQALPSSSLSWSARRLLERSKPGVLASDLQACNDYREAPELAAKLQNLILISGAKDRMTPVAGAKALVESHPQDLHVLPESGHMMILEKPAKIRRMIADAIN